MVHGRRRTLIYKSRVETVKTCHILFFADAPQSPNPVFVILNGTTIQVEWEAPFTWDGFPITNYTVIAINQTSQEELASEVLSPDMLSYSITMTAAPCTNITFLVWASNSVNRSHQPGIMHGAFPTSELAHFHHV